MSQNPNQPMIDFLSEQYRHYTALAAAAKRMLVALQAEKCYNEKVQNEVINPINASVTAPAGFVENH